MEPPDPPAKKRMASYADALRGHKAFAPKPKPAVEGKAEAPPTPKKAPKPAQSAAQKTSQKKGAKSTKGPKPNPKDVREGGASQAKQSAKASQPKSTKPKAQNAAEQPAKAQFSYAEAVKGKALVMPLRLKKAEAKQKTETAPPPSIEVAIPKLQPKTPPRPEFKQADLGTSNTDKPGDDGTCRPNEAEGVVRHPAADKMRRCMLDSAASQFSRVPFAARDAHLTTGEARQNLMDTHSQHMRAPGQVYNQRARRFSVGDLSSPSPFSSAPSHRTFSIPSAALSKPLPVDSYIEDTIQQAIMAENKRLKMTSERDNRMRDVIAAHDRGDISLWESQYEWDVLVKCGDNTWRVHRDILCRESELFKERLPPKDPNGGYVTFDCTGHDEMQLANALYFMYHTRQLTTTTLVKSALDCTPLTRATFLYICGVSVGSEHMQQTALRALVDAAWMLHLFLEQTGPLPLHDLDLSGLYDPLSRALAMAFEQGSGNDQMLRLRAALAHVVDVSMMWLVMNAGFCEALAGEGWMPGLWMSVVFDSIWFSQRGALDEMWEAMKAGDAKRREKGGVLEEFGGGGGGGGGSAAAAAGEGEGGEGSRASSSSTASRKRRREENKEEEEGFEIWVDGEPGGEVATPRWRRHQPLGETDDWMLDGEPFTTEQRREVLKENALAPLERGSSGRPRGGTGGGILRPRENFIDSHPPVPAYNPNAGRRGPNDWVARPNDEEATVNNGVERTMPDMARLR